MAEQMFLLCYKTAPSLFKDAGPACLRGKCPEGDKTCGKAAEIRKARQCIIEINTEEK